MINPHGIIKDVRCPICLGLGSYESTKEFRPPPNQHHMAVLHSDTDINDVIALLPWKKEEDDE